MSEFVIAWVDEQPEADLELGNELVPDGFRVVNLDGHAADALVTKAAAVDASVLAAAPQARFVQKYGGREDGIDLGAAGQAGVTVATMPLRGCIAVAELATTLILALSKQLVVAHRATVEGAYRELGLTPEPTSQRKFAFQWMKLPQLLEVHGRTLGIVGYGEIGTEVSVRARALGMDVLYTKRTRLPEAIERRLGVSYRPLDDLLAESDFVVLSLPHSPESDKIIGARELALMRPDAYLVNIARGPLVDEPALVDALASGRLRGAGLDVFVEEPVPYDNPLLALDNVIVTPHIGGGTGGARVNQMSDVLANVVRFARGEAPLHVLRED
jgi:phosphoglycerate dehydrogenase-like enzyme